MEQPPPPQEREVYLPPRQLQPCIWSPKRQQVRKWEKRFWLLERIPDLKSNISAQKLNCPTFALRKLNDKWAKIWNSDVVLLLSKIRIKRAGYQPEFCFLTDKRCALASCRTLGRAVQSNPSPYLHKAWWGMLSQTRQIPLQSTPE